MKTGIQVVILLFLLAILAYQALLPRLPRPPKPRIAFPEADVEIPVNPMIELDFMPREEFMKRRGVVARRFPAFVPASYKPSQEVFGDIVDRATWWGIEGIYHYGPGQRSIEGPSEESRFTENPLLLVGVCEGFTFPVAEAGRPKDVESYPTLKRLSWQGKSRVLHVTYKIAPYLRYLRRIRASYGRRLNWIAYNARDFGLNFLYVYPQETRHLELHQMSGKPTPICQFIHLGGSSGYKGGSNNASPRQPLLECTVQDLPARAMIGLWGQEPASVADPPDVRVLVEMH